MGKLDGIDTAGRKIAGLLGYNPGPGIYSRLERAIEAMPENVRVQELPGLLKRYKDGVPGWELKATDLDEVIAGRDVVPRAELLARVKERSPVYTHGEVVLGGTPQVEHRRAYVPVPGRPGLTQAGVDKFPQYQKDPSAIGAGVSHGEPQYESYGQGGKDYTEVLLTQPGQSGLGFGSHWSGTGKPQDQAVAHARFDVHDGFLRVNELQSDLGIHNRKMREQAAQAAEILRERGVAPGALGQPYDLPFPMEDAALDVLLKRLNLIAARQGLKGIEIASPRAIADKVGGSISNYEHAYGKVAVGNQQRLGRKLGGMVEEAMPQRSNAYEENLEALRKAFHEPSGEAAELFRQLRGGRISQKPQGAFDLTPTPLDRFDSLDNAYQLGMGPAYQPGSPPPRAGIGVDVETRHAAVRDNAERLYATLVEDLVSRGIEPAVATKQAGEAMPRLVRLAEEQAARNVSFVEAQLAPHGAPPPASKVVYRGIMSDEMRRRIIEQGIGASLLAPLAMERE